MSDLIATILSRCVEEGDCMIWQGAMSKNGSEGSPVMRIGRKVVRVRRLMLELHGRPVPADMNACTTCGESRCLNIDHLHAITNKAKSVAIAKTGVLQSMARRQKIAAAKRAHSQLTEEMVQEIRFSTEPGHVLAQRYPLCSSHANEIKRGASRMDYSSPMARWMR